MSLGFNSEVGVSNELSNFAFIEVELRQINCFRISLENVYIFYPFSDTAG
jgi:hypothetical protein